MAEAIKAISTGLDNRRMKFEAVVIATRMGKQMQWSPQAAATATAIRSITGDWGFLIRLVALPAPRGRKNPCGRNSVTNERFRAAATRGGLAMADTQYRVTQTGFQ